MTLSRKLKIALLTGIVASFLLEAGTELPIPGISFVTLAEARVGRPLTPVSVASRRTQAHSSALCGRSVCLLVVKRDVSQCSANASLFGHVLGIGRNVDQPRSRLCRSSEKRPVAGGRHGAYVEQG